MPEEYRKVVFDAYQKKKREGSLSSNLLDPTPGNVREECLIVYRERERDSKDEEIFKQFFKGDKEKGYLTVLENSPAEKFKQMPKILKGKVPKPGIKFIELLAYLIDFQPRSSTSYYMSFDPDSQKDKEKTVDINNLKTNETQTEATSGNNNEEQSLGNEDINIKEEDTEDELLETIDVDVTKQPSSKEEIEVKEPIIGDRPERFYKPRFSPRYITISCILLLFISTTSFVVWERSVSKVRLPKADEGCMYWNGDHYEPTRCDAQIAGATIVPLNLQVLTQQRKINLPDTLTNFSIGKVWYKGYGSNHEYFTFKGVYPADTARTLRALSSNILTKHTSNYRYMLTRLVWFLCAAFFISLCGIWASKLEKEVKSEDQFQKNDIKAVLSASETNEVLNEAELKVV
jgi:hypothetical protein